MILELLGLAGVGVYLYNKYGNKDEFKRKYQSNSREIIRAKRRYKEIDRVLFGKFITSPYDTEYFEFNCTTSRIPAANEIRQAVYVSSRCNPPAYLRASCSICDCEDGTYQHRWMVCCSSSNDMVCKDELIYAIYGEYLKERILT